MLENTITTTGTNMIYFLIIALLSIPIHAMDTSAPPARLTMGEKTPLLAGQPARVQMQDDEQPLLFDGSRHYFDEETRKNTRKTTIKQCLYGAALAGTGAGCLFCLIGCAFGGCLSACAKSTVGVVFCKVPGGKLVEFGLIEGSTGVFVGNLIGGIIGGVEAKGRFKKNSDPLKWKDGLIISPETLEAADSRLKLWIQKSTLKTLIQNAGYGSPLFTRTFQSLYTCHYQPSEKPIIANLRKRLERNITQLMLFHALREAGLPKDVVRYLFSFLKATDLPDITCISEKELFFLMRNVSDYGERKEKPAVCYDYASPLLLANTGWVSWTPTEKHPIRCEMGCFERSKHWYFLENGPVIYLPFTMQLSSCYKFEDDPAYAKQFAHPSSPQISALLLERQKYAPHNKLEKLLGAA